MTKLFQPIWKFRTEKIEKWLSEMAAGGQHLVEIKKWGIFCFRTGQPQTVIFGIGFNATNQALPQTLIRDGWEQVLRQGKWYIANTAKPREEIKIYPDRDQYRINVLRFLHRLSLVTQVALWILLFPLWVLAALFLFHLISIELPSWIWPMVFCLALLYLVTIIVSYIISRGKNSFILVSMATDASIIKRRLSWKTSPDRLERWLERMEDQGYRLHQVEGNKFYYTRSRRRKVKYCVDYQLMPDNRYYEIHTESGWTPVYTGHDPFGAWTIWAQEYQGYLPPQSLYNDKSNLIRHALRIAITTTLAVSIYIPWSFTLAKLEIDNVTRHGMNIISLGMLILFGTALLLSCIYLARTWSYYRRLRKG